MQQYTQLKLQAVPSVRHLISYQRFLTQEEYGLLHLGFTPDNNHKDFLAFCHQDMLFIFNQHTKQYIAHMTIGHERGRHCLKATEINASIKKHTEHMKNHLNKMIEHILNYNYINS